MRALQSCDMVGRYMIEGALGKGGFGAVYKALDTKLRKTVAIKVLSDSEGAEESYTRFIHEIKSILQLHHPNIIQIFDYDLGGDTPFYAMEYLKGEDLESLLHREKRLKLSSVFNLCQQLCGALHAVHQDGIIYRDLKPQNIFLVKTHTYHFVKLLDFGLALAPDTSRVTGSGKVVGTPLFMSPEQITKPQQLTARADIYAFGMLLFHMITGEFPYTGEDRFELLRQHIMEEPQLSHPLISDEMKSFLERLLHKTPKERPENMLSVWKELRRILIREMRRQGTTSCDGIEVQKTYSIEGLPGVPLLSESHSALWQTKEFHPGENSQVATSEVDVIVPAERGVEWLIPSAKETIAKPDVSLLGSEEE
ncbi:MAG TPA: hypothetical protein DCE42_05005 [Myxococcales bacterium]|nr:hypothetical protein [Deltaproteobacteria bacterium]HAA54089.1 hypothetical protein [Myxococcales bacterium]